MYDKEQIQKMIKEVKQFNITTTKKVQHYAQLEAVRKLYNTACNINLNLFNTIYEYNFITYQENIKQKNTKKILDKNLYNCKKYLLNELYKIIEVIDNYKYDNIKGKYIKKIA